MTVFQSQTCEDFLEHWKSLRTDGALVPTQQDYLDHPHPRFAPYIHIAEIADSDLIIRLMGTALVERWGRDKTGEVIGLDQPPKIKEALHRNSQISHGIPCGFRLLIEMAASNGSEMAIEAVCLPLNIETERLPRVISYSSVLQQLKYGDHSERYLGLTAVDWIDLGAGIPDDAPLVVPRVDA